ncbi:MAG: neutral zinc metallopeptidase, partial [Acidobacteriota bacterium]
MQWGRGESSDYVEDRRGSPGMRMGGGLGIGGLIIVGLITWLSGGDLNSILSLLSDGGQSATTSAPATQPGAAPKDEGGQFATFMANDTQQVWGKILGSKYRPAHLVLFTDATQSGCGFAQAATGPFYCPADQKVYIDLSFYNELEKRFGAGGEFARAYVLAHEM